MRASVARRARQAGLAAIIALSSATTATATQVADASTSPNRRIDSRISLRAALLTDD